MMKAISPTPILGALVRRPVDGDDADARNAGGFRNETSSKRSRRRAGPRGVSGFAVSAHTMYPETWHRIAASRKRRRQVLAAPA